MNDSLMFFPYNNQIFIDGKSSNLLDGLMFAVRLDGRIVLFALIREEIFEGLLLDADCFFMLPRLFT